MNNTNENPPTFVNGFSFAPQTGLEPVTPRLAVPKIAYRLGAPSDFDRYAVQRLPASAAGSGSL